MPRNSNTATLEISPAFAPAENPPDPLFLEVPCLVGGVIVVVQGCQMHFDRNQQEFVVDVEEKPARQAS